VRQLVRELRARGFLAELVSVPFKWYPKEEILPHASAWRLLDLSESNGRPIDRVIASKFPSYFVRHPNKVAWLIHQYRAAYELCGTEYSDFAHTELDVGLRDTLMALDTKMLGECRAVFTNARNTAGRLAKFNGLAAEPLYHPPQLAGRLVAGVAAPGGGLLAVVSEEAWDGGDVVLAEISEDGQVARRSPPLRANRVLGLDAATGVAWVLTGRVTPRPEPMLTTSPTLRGEDAAARKPSTVSET